MTIPNLSALCGVSPKNLIFNAQMFQLDKGAAQGVSITAGLRIKTGK